MFINQGLGWITKKEFRNDEKTNIFLAIESLLENVAAIAISGQVNDTAPVRCQERQTGS